MRGRTFSRRTSGSGRPTLSARTAILVAVAALTAATCTNLAGAQTAGRASTAVSRPSARAVTTATMAMYLENFARNGHYGSDTRLPPSAISALQKGWKTSLKSIISAQPVIYGGIIYIGAWDGYEYAVNASTGTILWKTYLSRTVTPPSERCSPAAAGIASSAAVVRVNGSLRVITGTGFGEVASLNASNGHIVWETRIDPKVGGFEWSSSAVYNGSVYVGVSSFGDCPLVEGKMMMLNAATGAIEHEYAIPVPKGCSGDGIWGSPSINPLLHLVFATTGNANTATGKNCYSTFGNAFLAFSTSTVQLKGLWHIPKGSQFLNADFGAGPTLFFAKIGGKELPLLGAASKDGIFYALRQADIAAGPVWTARIANSGDCPECGEGSISPAAFDGTNLYVAGGHTVTKIDGKQWNGSIRDLNPANGHVRWVDGLFDAMLAAVTETPGVVYVAFGPEIQAINAKTGKVLFKYFDPVKNDLFYGPVTPDGPAIYFGGTDGWLRQFVLKTP
jgi:outer membrane protein assembly factor BamB